MPAEAVEQIHPGHHEGDPVVLDFQTPDKTGERPWQQMAIDGHPVMVREPKSAFFLGLSERLVSGSEAEQIGATNEVLQKVFDEAAREHIKARMDDDDDDFDVDELGDIILKLQELWGKGRGGSASGSRTSSQPRSKRSTARRR